jgi:hypothetical protein
VAKEKPMNRGHLDELIMLLSTDWFAPYWFKIGLGADHKTKVCLQQRLREIVRQIISGVQQYWLVNFSNERLSNTRALLTAALRKCEASAPTVDRIAELVDGRECSKADESTRWLVISISDQMSQGSLGAASQPSSIAAHALEKLLRIANRQNQSERNFEELCLESESEWDGYIRSLTPDLPTKLADFLKTISTQDHFEQLWAVIHSDLSVEERHELLEWYRTVAQSLTGERLQLPEEG